MSRKVVDPTAALLQYRNMKGLGANEISQPMARPAERVAMTNHFGHLALLLMLAVSACSRPNPVVCCTDPNDCASIGLNTENERSCEGDLRCVDNICTEVTTCLNNEDCTGGAPFCEEGLCVQCLTDPDCSTDAARCSEEHVCVECLQSEDCPAARPFCDVNAHTCRPCQLDSECASEVCDAETGGCVDSAAVVYAAPDAPAGTACTQANPCSITSAFAIANLVRETVKLAAGTYVANIAVADKKVVVHGDGAILTSNTGTTLAANNRARLRVIGLTIIHADASGAGEAFMCEEGVDHPFVEFEAVTIDTMTEGFLARGCTATVVRSRIHGRSDALLVGAVDDARVTIDQTLIDGGPSGGVGAFNGAVVRVTNSTIVDQNSPSFGALTGTNGVVLVSFSTIVNSVIKCGTGVVSCMETAPHGVCIDNSIIANMLPNAPLNTIEGTRCHIEFSIAHPQTTAPNGVNNQLSVDPLFVDSVAGNYRLEAGSPAVDSANPSSTLTIDFDGNPRPQGAANDRGAFERLERTEFSTSPVDRSATSNRAALE